MCAGKPSKRDTSDRCIPSPSTHVLLSTRASWMWHLAMCRGSVDVQCKAKLFSLFECNPAEADLCSFRSYLANMQIGMRGIATGKFILVHTTCSIHDCSLPLSTVKAKVFDIVTVSPASVVFSVTIPQFCFSAWLHACAVHQNKFSLF
jgi:hypothetical protein